MRPDVKRRTLLAAPLVAALAQAVGTGTARAATAAVHPRAEDLLGKLTLNEKISLLHQYQPAVPRLGMKAFRTGTEALHGMAWLGEATVFPQAVGLASTWNPDLIERVGGAVGDEVRGLQHERPAGWGLNVWAPVVNLLRDPRWGRNEEGYSEDPYLTGVLSTAYGNGLTGGDPGHLKTAPTLKHFLANNNEVNRAGSSSDLRPRVLKEYDEQAFRPAIAAGAATGVMSSYNLVNGRPCTVNPEIDATVRGWSRHALINVTDAWAPNNLLPSGTQDYYATLAEADAAALKAGIDSFTTDDTDSGPTVRAVHDALDQGLLTEADIDAAARHILDIRVRLGEFDTHGGRYGRIDSSVINSAAHRRLARTAAGEAMVLLKNADGALPLAAGRLRKVAVVGPLAGTLYSDWYSGTLPYAVTPVQGVTDRLGSGAEVVTSEGVDRITLRNARTGAYVTAGGATQALAEKATSAGESEQFDAFDWGAGVLTLRSVANGKYVGQRDPDGSGPEEDLYFNDQDQPNGWFVSQQFSLVEQSDGTCLLKYAGYENWYGDAVWLGARADGTLHRTTEDKAGRYAKDVVRSGTDHAVAAAADADVAVVVVGSMPFINGREDHDRTDMALAAGQEALAEAVLAANPATVLVVENSYPTTLTWAQEHVPAILWTTHAGQETGNALADVLFGDVNPSGRLTQTWYRSADDLPSILEYDIIKYDRTYLYFRGDPLYPFGHGLSYTTFRYGRPRLRGDAVEVAVTNTGRRAGAEVVQLYVRQHGSRVKQPLKRLRAFAKTTLEPGRTKTVRLPLARADLAHWDVTRSRWVVESGRYEIMVGSSSADIRGRTTLHVDGETVPPRDLSRTTRAADFDDYAGIRLVDESKAHGTAVGADGAGAWLKFADTALGGGRFTARVAKESAGGTTVEIRLGSPDGTLIGTAQAASTGSRYEYAQVTADLAKARGRRDVYLVLGAGLRISSFSLH